MREDPVELIFKIVTLNQKKHLKAIQYMSVIIWFFLESCAISGVSSLYNINFSFFMEYVTGICLLQPGCAGLWLAGNFMVKLEKALSTIRGISKYLEIQNANFENKVLIGARQHIIISILLLTFNISINIVCIPFLIDDGFGDLLYYTSKRFFGNIPDSIYLFLIFCCFIVSSFAITLPLLYMNYFTFHINFQLMWLSAYIKRNLHKKLNLYTENSVCQELIHEHLISLVKYRLCFQNAFDTIHMFQNNSIFLLGSSGFFVGVMSVYNMRNNTPQGTSIKIYLVLLNAAIMMLLYSSFSQSITDKSTEFRDLLYDCPWMYWNEKNRKVLLLMITNTKNPWNVSFYKLFFINHQAITKAAKLIYSFSAVVSKFK